ncbi:MAG: NCS1 family nucleobase:cation symporter-1 [Candidatus Sumerlaeia bacterium]|nr:NCS1 family nucleobase:cation symporter-1 [Candidatus Sumerlaeia bacterium]
MTDPSPTPAPHELVETTVELSDAPLWNADIAPTRLDQRTWNRWNIAALWIGMAVCIPTYMLASGLVAKGMSWWQALLVVLLGNAIVLVPMVLNAHAGTRYGIPFPVLARSSFGLIGSNVPALMRAMVACGWFGIQTWIGGSAVYTLHAIATPGLVQWLDGFGSFLGMPLGAGTFIGLTGGQLVAFLVFWLVNMVFVWIGTESIRWLEALAAPFLLAIGLVLLVWAWGRAGGLGPMLSQPSSFETFGEFFRFFVPALTGMVGFWATLSLNISDFTRYATSQKDQMIGQAIGLPPTMALFAFIGVAVTSATVVIFGEAIDDPIALLARFDSRVVVLLSLFALTLATISTNIAANIVSPANDFSNVAPRLVSFRIGGTIAGVIGILIMPWKLIANPDIYIFTWLIGYSALLGPIAGVMICDYWLVRRQRLDVAALYRPGGEYPLVNWAALGALVAGIALNAPGFAMEATNGRLVVPGFFQQVYSYAWFSGFAVAFGVYWGLMRLRRGGA